MNLSPLLDSLVDGSFHEAEMNSRACPYVIDGEVFNFLFLLVDGIYPSYSRFVRTIHEPVTRMEKAYADWQEACRKDIERAFAALQGRWQATSHPFQQHDLGRIADVMISCLIMHNMCVADRIMEGDVNATYNASNGIDIDVEDINVEYPGDFEAVVGGTPAHGEIGLGNGDDIVTGVILNRQDHWKTLNDRLEHTRLTRAIANHVS